MVEKNCYKIAPSILSADMSRLANAVRDIEAAGADWVHVDVMDGRFVPNITVGIPVVASLKNHTGLPLDVHLMIVEPERYIGEFAKAGASCITVQAEATYQLYGTLKSIRELGCKAGVALSPATPVTVLENVLEVVDFVLIMTVEPGFGGQSFIPAMLSKIVTARKLIQKSSLSVDIQVDGGIKSDTIGSVAKAGANIFVSGSGVFNPMGVEKSILGLREALERAIK